MLDESLRWVIANGRKEEAKRIIKNACSWNKKDYDIVIEKVGLGDSKEPGKAGEELQDMKPLLKTVNGNDTTHGNAENGLEVGSKERKYPILQIWKNKHIRRVSLILWYTW